jgi:DNA helicase-2/ATP-dependent DNA helicase PcrA
MDRLYLLRTFRRTIYGQSELSTPSRFLADAPQDFVEGHPVQIRTSTAQSRPKSGERGVTRWSRSTAPPPSSSAAKPSFNVGDTVVHAKFGEGVVIKVHMTDDDQEVEVAFPDQGIKKLSVSFAPLQKR